MAQFFEALPASAHPGLARLADTRSGHPTHDAGGRPITTNPIIHMEKPKDTPVPENPQTDELQDADLEQAAGGIVDGGCIPPIIPILTPTTPPFNPFPGPFRTDA